MYAYTCITLFNLTIFKLKICSVMKMELCQTQKSLWPQIPWGVLHPMTNENKGKTSWLFHLKMGPLWPPILVSEAMFNPALKLDSSLKSILFLSFPFHSLGFQEHFIIYVSPTNLHLNICFPENLAYNGFPQALKYIYACVYFR